MTVDQLTHTENYKEQRYAVHCTASSSRKNKWNVWVEIFSCSDPALPELVLSAEHAHTFATCDEGRAAGALFAQQLIDSELVQP